MTLRGLAPEDSLDPADWEAFKDLAHRLLDDAIDHLRTVRERPVWQPVPDAVRQALAQPLPVQGQGLERTCREVRDLILPYATGNTHPRFWGWVNGSGTPGGVLAELIAAAMNANCGDAITERSTSSVRSSSGAESCSDFPTTRVASW